MDVSMTPPPPQPVVPVQPVDRRTLWYGAPGGDDSKRSRDEIRMIKEMTQEDVENFLKINSIDTAAAKELLTEPPHIALAVLERGPLRACVNPSGALVARIRDAKRGAFGGGQRFGSAAQPLAMLDPNASEADKFLAANQIDQAGVASFRGESREIQALVIAKGTLINSTNPSASLMARIRNVKLNAQAAVSGLGGCMAAPGQQPALGPSLSGVPSTPAPAAPAPLSLEDKQLQNEALKAIQALNGGL